MSPLTCVLIGCLSVSAAITVPRPSSVAMETELIRQLLGDYVKEARPVLIASHSVQLSVQVSFVGIDDIDESKNVFTSTILLVQMWNDPRLKWNSTNYGGVKKIRLPVNKLWIPDIVAYNPAGLFPGKPRNNEISHVLADGTVVWVPMLTIATKCPMDVTDFPFDKQTCQIVLGSWVHSSAEINMTFLHTPAPEVDLSSDPYDVYPFSSHPNWDMESAVAKIRNVKYACCEDPFTLLTVHVRLGRRSTFYRLLAIGPAAVYGFLVPILFLIPSRSEGKTTYGMLLIIGVTLLILTLDESIPFSHNKIPKIGYFYLCTMALSACSVLLSIFINNLSTRGGRHKAVPAWLKWVCLSRNGCRCLFCIGNYSPVDNLYNVSLKDLHSPETAQTSRAESEAAQYESESASHMSEIRRYLQYLVGKQSAEVTYRNICQEWEELARVFDRILFVTFLVLYIVFSVHLLT